MMGTGTNHARRRLRAGLAFWFNYSIYGQWLKSLFVGRSRRAYWLRWVLAVCTVALGVSWFSHASRLKYRNVGPGYVYALHSWKGPRPGSRNYNLTIHVDSQKRNVTLPPQGPVSRDKTPQLYEDAAFFTALTKTASMPVEDVEVDTYDNEISRVRLEDGSWDNAWGRQGATGFVVSGVVAIVCAVLFVGQNIRCLMWTRRSLEG